MSDLRFADLVTIYRAAQYDLGSSRGVIEISNEEILVALKKSIADDAWEESGIELDVDDPVDLAIGQTHSIKIGLPRTGLGMVVQGLKEFLDSAPVRIAEPPQYFLLNEKFSKDDLVVPEGIQKYRKILAFVELLKASAAYTDTNQNELVFLHDGKFVIPVKYSKAEIENIEIDSFDKLIAFFADDIHKLQKLTILSNTILPFVQISARNRRFEVLLTEISTITSKFSDGYKLFIADFSYDKIREQFEADKVEYSNRIHKVFSDIQGQLLSIPVATIVVATQMKIATDGSGELTNKALLLGAWVFSVIFCLLCFNQWKTLSTIKSEINKKESKIESEYEKISGVFEKIFDNLHSRIAQQYIFLSIVILILVGGLISTHVFYFKIQNQNESARLKALSAQPNNRTTVREAPLSSRR